VALVRPLQGHVHIIQMVLLGCNSDVVSGTSLSSLAFTVQYVVITVMYPYLHVTSFYLAFHENNYHDAALRSLQDELWCIQQQNHGLLLMIQTFWFKYISNGPWEDVWSKRHILKMCPALGHELKEILSHQSETV
jgi:hypothetical protein